MKMLAHLSLCVGLGMWFSAGASAGASVACWLSTEDGACSLSPGPALEWNTSADADSIPIEIFFEKTDQTMLGMGASFDHATCYNLSLLDETAREAVLRRLMDPEQGIGMNLMRVCIGTSDFAGEPWYSYDDMPEGETDPELKQFSIEKDRAYVLPAIKMVQRLNPDVLFFASPWSPPGWMKKSGTLLGGRINPDWYGAYAKYLLEFVRAYEAEGVPIYAMTLQNEPRMGHPGYPTCLWTGEEQRDFIRDHLGPLFEQEKAKPLIWCWDHNFNELAFPRAVLSDPAAARYVDGTAFHFYEGRPEAMAELKKEFPEKQLYFTEGSTFRARGALQLIDILRNGARAYNLWVVMLDENRGPNNGPHHASQTCLRFNAKERTVEYGFDYYMYGQFMKFIQRGAVRLETSPSDKRLGAVAFRNPDGAIVMVAANASANEQSIRLVAGGEACTFTMPQRAVATFRWVPDSQ